MSGTDAFKDIKGEKVSQVALLLGPTCGGKTELFEALRSLEEIGVRKRSLFALPENPSNPKLSRAFENAEAKQRHAKPGTMGIGSISDAVNLFKASLRFVDGTGLENDSQQSVRISDFVDKHIKPKPRRWKDGVFAILVFNIKDILAGDKDKCEHVEASYRDVLEIWGAKIWPDLEEEALNNQKKKASDPKRKIEKIEKKPIRPPLAVIFVASHMDELSPVISIQDANNAVNNFVRRIEGVARNILPLPQCMPNIDSRSVLGDLKSLHGRIEFAKQFYKIRKDLTERMQEQMEAQK